MSAESNPLSSHFRTAIRAAPASTGASRRTNDVPVFTVAPELTRSHRPCDWRVRRTRDSTSGRQVVLSTRTTTCNGPANVTGNVSVPGATGGLMLVTTAGAPLWRPTSDPARPDNRLPTPDVPLVGLRIAGPRTVALSSSILPMSCDCSGRRSRRRALRVDQPIGSPRPPATLHAVAVGGVSTPPVRRTGERRPESGLSRSAG